MILIESYVRRVCLARMIAMIHSSRQLTLNLIAQKMEADKKQCISVQVTCFEALAWRCKFYDSAIGHTARYIATGLPPISCRIHNLEICDIPLNIVCIGTFVFSTAIWALRY